jgi:hypothetical protein
MNTEVPRSDNNKGVEEAAYVESKWTSILCQGVFDLYQRSISTLGLLCFSQTVPGNTTQLRIFQQRVNCYGGRFSSGAASEHKATMDAAKLTPKDPLQAQLISLAQSLDAIRGKIVATKEGGAITGEYLGDLYGNVSQYEDKPTEEQLARADVMGRQLDEVVVAFNKFASSQLPGINSKLKGRHMPPIEELSE